MPNGEVIRLSSSVRIILEVRQGGQLCHHFVTFCFSIFTSMFCVDCDSFMIVEWILESVILLFFSCNAPTAVDCS